MPEWTPSSWQAKPALQLAEWEDKALAKKVQDKLGKLPPLVQATEADRLKQLLAEAGRGERFIVQGGDCAERFIDCEAGRLETQLRLILQVGAIVEHVAGRPTVKIARIAGQYGKPRSKPTEVVEGYGEIMSFKGDNINGFDPKDRKWDPERLLQGYFHSAATLNFLRSFTSASSTSVLGNIGIDSLKASKDYPQILQDTQRIQAKHHGKEATEFFTSHEAMQLDLEEALTRKVGNKYYNLSAHLVWIGDRTRQVSGAHVEYFRGISNPIGVKVGPSMKNDELKELLQILNPNKEEGRIVLITRYGAGKVEKMLPGHIQAVKECGIPVTWQCDAVHGNGIVAASNKYKTRKCEDIIQEVIEAMACHKRCGSILGGVHLEVTGQTTVTECLGGCIGLTEKGLESNYETYCDPRLNYSQSIEVAFAVAREMPSDGVSHEQQAKRARTA
jgi:3-deoxy-7-phosphoheptulonate synthase